MSRHISTFEGAQKESDKALPLLVTNLTRLSKVLSSMATPELVSMIVRDAASQSSSEASYINHDPLHYEDEAMHKFKVEHGLEDETKNKKKHKVKTKKFKRKHSVAMESALLKEHKNTFRLVDHNGHEHTYVALIAINVISAKNLVNGDAETGGVSDPFPVLTLGRQEEEGRVVMNTLNPTWNTRFLIPWDGFSVLKIEVFDYDMFGEPDCRESLGYIETSLVLLEVGKTFPYDIPLKGVASGSLRFDVTVKILPP